jgi:CelD/BcsL family acetyltransferase involved in cellulose biosynthesis
VLSPKELSPAELAKWRELSDAALEPNLFLDPHYCGPMLGLLHAAGVRVAVAERGDVWVAAIAIVPVATRIFGSNHRVLTTGGAVIDHLYRTHPLVRAEQPTTHLAALIQGLRTLNLGGIMHLDDLFWDGPLAAAIIEAADEIGAPTLVDHRGYQGFASRASAVAQSERDIFGPAHLSKSRRNKLRRNARLLAERAGGELAYVNHGTDPAALKLFIDMQASGWKGDAARGGKAIALDGGRKAAFELAVADAAAQESIFIGALHAGDRPIYMAMALRGGERVVCDVLDAFDEELRDLSAGALGRLAHLAYVRRTWPDADFDPAVRTSSPDIAGLYPEQRPTAGIYVAFGGVSAKGAIRGARLARRLRDGKGV